jgi:hypothetical protein
MFSPWLRLRLHALGQRETLGADRLEEFLDGARQRELKGGVSLIGHLGRNRSGGGLDVTEY